MKKFLILDCFVDEPACLGVPPFISPYPRYIYGALIDAGIDEDRIDYLTIDHMRGSDFKLQSSYTGIFLIGGAVVPGKYLGARIGTLQEILKILDSNPHHKIAVGGLISSAVSQQRPNTETIHNDIEMYAYSKASGNGADEKRTQAMASRWGVLGAPVVKNHPWFPHIICEIETGRGCPRLRHCSFCSEGLAGAVEFRETEDVINEVDALISCGVKRFRIGRQADIIQYRSEMNEFRGDFPKPNPAAVEELFSALKDRRERGLIDILNVDNGNPGSIAKWPDESARILTAIGGTVTPGDTLPFGVESFDISVINQNRLKTTPEETIFAVKMMNEICGNRIEGIPALLPGINLIQGLRGETAETFKTNYRYLMQIADMGLLVKRINIRKLLPFPGTELYNEKAIANKGLLNRFEFFREKIRDDIDRFMLKEIYPAGTVLKNNLVLDRRDSYSFAKQIASYSITVKIPWELELKSFQDILVTGQRERSLAGIPLPFNVNKAGQKALEAIPGINRDKATQIIIKRPFNNISEVSGYLKDVPQSLQGKLIEQIKL